MKDTTNGEAKVSPPQSRDDAGAIAGESVEQVGALAGEFPVAKSTTREPSTGRSAFLVGAGILISRIIGLVRQRVFAHYFGLSDAGDAFNAAFRIPNFLQNVFGEGALSASFIPVYAKLLSRGEKEEATRLANAVLTILVLASSVIVLLGVITTPYLIALIAPGFDGEKRELTIRLVKIFFPGAGLLVFSAWCLGILNSHRRFFLSYTAPVVWNLAIIASLVFFGRRLGQFPLAEAVAWGSVIGSALQFFVQLPTVFSLVKGLKPTLQTGTANVRLVLRNFFPVFFSRSVVQISAFVDAWLASWLGTGAVAALGYTQSIYTLPVSLFGMSVSAAELPTMSTAVGTTEEVAAILRKRLNSGLQRIAFFIVPSAIAFMFLGDVIAAVLYQTGEFRHEAAVYLWGILAGSGIGLLAATLGRLYSSTYYALHDTRTPLIYAIVHVALATCFGYLWSIPLPGLLGIEQKWGVVGLTASASLGAWVEFFLLRAKLNRRIGNTGLAASYIWELECGKKDRRLFKKAIKTLDKIARQTHDLSIFTDGERRYGNLLFEICYDLVNNGKPGRPKKTFKRGVHFRIKKKGAQAHKKGRKRPKYQSPWKEHPETARTIAETNIHANHAEAFFSALRRKCATFRRKTNMYAKVTTGLQRLLRVYWVVHNFLRVHFTIREVPAVALGILERRLTVQEIFQIQIA